MSNSIAERPVLVAVGNPEHAEQLVRTAGDLARASDGVVRIASVIVKSSDSPFSVYSDETIIDQYAGDSREILDNAIAAAPDDVAVDDAQVVSQSVADGILMAVEQTDARALVVGWHDRGRRTDSVLGSTIDRLIERVPCDLYVERIGHEANGVDSILVPVAGGPHVRPAVGVAKAIAARNDATVAFCSVADDGTEPAGARGYIERAKSSLEDAPGPPVESASTILEGDDVVAELLEAAAEHDIVVFGATRQGALHRRLVGSIPRTMVHRTDRTVILARDGDAVSGPVIRQLRRLIPTP